MVTTTAPPVFLPCLETSTSCSHAWRRRGGGWYGTGNMLKLRIKKCVCGVGVGVGGGDRGSRMGVTLHVCWFGTACNNCAAGHFDRGNIKG
jgi:hypothetical protein